MRKIQVALAGGDACVSFWSALERIHRICGMGVCAIPRRSLEEVVPGSSADDRTPMIVADLPAGVVRYGAWARYEDLLRSQSASEPRPTVVLYIPPIPTSRVRALSSMGVDQFIVSTESDYPRAVQRVLTRVLLPGWGHAFIERLPAPPLPLDLDLALRRFLSSPEAGSLAPLLAERCGRSEEDVRRAFDRSGLRSPEAVYTFGLIYAGARKEQESEGGGSAGCERSVCAGSISLGRAGTSQPTLMSWCGARIRISFCKSSDALSVYHGRLAETKMPCRLGSPLGSSIETTRRRC